MVLFGVRVCFLVFLDTKEPSRPIPVCLHTWKQPKGKKGKKKERRIKVWLKELPSFFLRPPFMGMCTTNAVLRGAAFKLGRKHGGLQNSFLVTVSQLKRRCSYFGFCSVFFLPGQRAALLLWWPSLGYVVCLVLGCNYSPAWTWPTFPNEIMDTRVLSRKL